MSSTPASGNEPYASPEYGAAKAGLIRFTSALAKVDGVRVNCIVPDWIATERVTAAQRSSTPPPIPLQNVVDAVLTLIRDDTLAGQQSSSRATEQAESTRRDSTNAVLVPGLRRSLPVIDWLLTPIRRSAGR